MLSIVLLVHFFFLLLFYDKGYNIRLDARGGDKKKKKFLRFLQADTVRVEGLYDFRNILRRNSI